MSEARRICPYCSSGPVSRRHRKGIVDYALSVAGLYPYRCGKCERSFRAPRSADQASRDDAAPGVICPRCGGRKSRRIPSGNVTPRLGNYFWRKFGVPGYRCPECRMRFFSMRPRVSSPE